MANEKSTRTIAVENLRSANKETKSISGTLKVIAEFWRDGYRLAFEDYLGITKKQLTIELIKTLHESMYVSPGIVGKYVKVARTLNGEFVTDAKGRKVYDKKLREVTTWTPNTLFNVLEDSAKAKGLIASTSKVATKPTTKPTEKPAVAKRTKAA